jgi:glycosyltransferase 2 family protein
MRPPMKLIKAFYFLLGLGLLAFIVSETDLEAVWAEALEIGVMGMAVVLVLYFLAFLIDSITWTMTLLSLPLNLKWIIRTLSVRMVGETFNNVIPAGGMGGEPVKAVLLKRHYGIRYREATASLVLAKTINMVSLCIFLVFGFVFMMLSEKLTVPSKQVAGLGLAFVLTATGLLFAVQRLRMTSLTSDWLSRFSFAARLNDILHHLQDFDTRLIDFYTRYRSRFIAAVLLALVNWLLGIAEIYYAMVFLGAPVTWAEAYIIEAVTQMVRMGTFFIPLSLGAQEGAFLVVVGAITGSSTLGLAIGMVRRLRELIWVVLGGLLGVGYSLKGRQDLSKVPEDKDQS